MDTSQTVNYKTEAERGYMAALSLRSSRARARGFEAIPICSWKAQQTQMGPREGAAAERTSRECVSGGGGVSRREMGCSPSQGAVSRHGVGV